jgi:hypothetical protein
MSATFSCDTIGCPEHGHCYDDVNGNCIVHCPIKYTYAPGLLRCIPEYPCKDIHCPPHAVCTTSIVDPSRCNIECEDGFSFERGIECVRISSTEPQSKVEL